MADSLSQSELDTLLSGLEIGLSGCSTRATSSDSASPDSPASELLSHLSSVLSRNLTAGLEKSLRGRCEVSLGGFVIAPYSRTLAGLDDRCVAVVESRPAGSHSLIAMNSEAVFSMVDCLLGGGSGGGDTTIPDRPLTDIELKVITRCLNAVVGALEQAWTVYAPAEFQIAHVEGRLPAVSLFAPRERVVSLELKTTVNDQPGRVTLVLPERPILDLAVGAGLSSDATSQDETPHDSSQFPELRVRLGAMNIKAGTLAALQVSDILPLPPDVNLREAQVLVDGRPAYLGEPGLSAGRKAVRIHSVISSNPDETRQESSA